MTPEPKGARASIISAFNRLILSRRKLRPRVADVLEEAGVARSTFYEHFDGRDSLLLTAVRGPLGVVAAAAAGPGDATDLARILDHLRENRRGAVELLTGPLGPRVVRTLAALIVEKCGDTVSANKTALHLADMQLGFIRLWLCGETPYASIDLAELMIRSAKAQRKAIAPGETS